MHKRQLTEALNDWRDWPVTQRPQLIKIFNDGYSHASGLIKDGERHLVLKLFANANRAAIKAQQLAARHNLAPPVHFVNSRYTLSLSNYIDANTLTKGLVSGTELQNLGCALRRMHELPDDTLLNEIGEFGVLEFCDQYISVLDHNETKITKLQQQILPALSDFSKDQTPFVFCHNDLVAENCFANSISAQFIDWEYAQWNNPWFDLATIIYHCQLNRKQVGILIHNYEPDFLDMIDTPLYYSSQCAVLWLDILWHLAHTKDSSQNLSIKLVNLQHLAQPLGIDLLI